MGTGENAERRQTGRRSLQHQTVGSIVTVSVSVYPLPAINGDVFAVGVIVTATFALDVAPDVVAVVPVIGATVAPLAATDAAAGAVTLAS